MSAIAELSDGYDYDPHTHDRAAWWDHHRALVAAMEPAKWPRPENKYHNNEHMFTDDEVVEIRTAFASGSYTQQSLAELFGCEQSHIGYITRGEYYKYAGGPITHCGTGYHPRKPLAS